MSYRLAVLCDAVELGGAEQFIAYLIAELPSDVRVTLVGRDVGVLAAVAAARPGTGVVRIDMNVRAAASALRRLRPDVAHVNLPSLTSCRPLLLAALALRMPVVIVDHLPGPGLAWRGRALQRAATWRSRARVSVGAEAARRVERYAGLRDDSVRAIANGVPRRAPAPARAPGAPCAFGFLGRLEHQKGLDLLLAALRGVPGPTLEIMGAGSQEAVLRSEADDLADRVTFTPASPQTAEFWERIDVFVLPSRNEAMPLVVLEALQAGRPVIATDVGSVAEVAPEPAVTLVPPEDVAALAAALLRFDADPDLRRRAREAALHVASSMWTASEMAGEYDALYRSVSGRVAQSRPPARDAPAV